MTWSTIHYRGEHEYKTYTSEFRTEALVSEQGYSVQEATSALGITTSLLYSWKQKYFSAKLDAVMQGDLNSRRQQFSEHYEISQ